MEELDCLFLSSPEVFPMVFSFTKASWLIFILIYEDAKLPTAQIFYLVSKLSCRGGYKCIDSKEENMNHLLFWKGKKMKNLGWKMELLNFKC